MWEQLKKDARKLEGELEVKLSHYSRISSGLDNSTSGGVRSLHSAAAIQSDITTLLKRLQEVHNAMEADVSGSDIRHHTVTRHREILQDFSHEFRRLSAQLEQVRCPSAQDRTLATACCGDMSLSCVCPHSTNACGTACVCAYLLLHMSVFHVRARMPSVYAECATWLLAALQIELPCTHWEHQHSLHTGQGKGAAARRRERCDATDGRISR